MVRAQQKIRDRKPFVCSASMSVEQCHFISGEHPPVSDYRFKIQGLTKLIIFILGKMSVKYHIAQTLVCVMFQKSSLLSFSNVLGSAL